ncbi:MFS transporter, ACS family, solute carrier family 17 (sodium-dependent inorganic phosphate cotransporter), other [Nesidiocoris tenuis]|uniref:MFS transporter, ACS family, solute carrier family 17 (Sodium-dependent inorganic phosphate cotransporter), other n=1 Tax=Nesidiocoris tenuis TaxID=355587 RepID=A0ABN7BEW8_9HEMI|nr:MFS transporter, ACS family, solute carrier family 17 (sodium-dependent inorganic phosphate cotransporter), other [Nesidiocoris tenuis]
MSPVDEAAYWVEYVLKHGNVLQPASVQMPFYQIYMLDILAALMGACFLVIIVAKIVIQKVFDLIFGRKKSIKKSERQEPKKQKKIKSKKE